MSEASTTLPEQTVHDIIDLQGQEIVRLREELAQLTDRYADLKRENSRLKAAAVALKKTQNLGAGEPGSGDYKTSPSYMGAPITPFRGKYSRIHRHLKAARKIVGRINVLVVRKAFMWTEKYDSGFVLKPNGRLTKKGDWFPSKHKKLFKQNHMVLLQSDQWYYLGVYDYNSTEVLSPKEYSELPTQLQSDLISLSGAAKHAKELARRLTSGEIQVMKFNLQRVAFDDAVQDALFKAKVNQSDGSKDEEEADDSEDE